MVFLIFGTTCALSELFKLFYPRALTTHIVRGWQTHMTSQIFTALLVC